MKLNYKFTFIFVNTLFVFIFFLSCSTTKPAVNGNTEKKPIITDVKHLVFIGFDGWGGTYVQKANMPAVKQMIADGASSTTVYNILPCITWPNWSSLFYGTPPEKRPENDFPSIFSITNSKDTAFFYEYYELVKINSANKNYSLKIDSSLESAFKIASYIREKTPMFTAIIVDEPDVTGHKTIWGSKKYYEKLITLDCFFAIIKQAIIDAGMYDDTVFVFSADHGGFLKGHTANFPRNRKIPLIICGKGIKKGYTITSAATICDIAPTMALILGLEIPVEWTGFPIFEIFE
ncbi:MAG: alkaline phosphatase [Treponema sp.]|jgi:predicted AlkP superfamily pyrophosphatase or phosphodiesterase|nr:alkaline phosphatase [Treponema sp.]